MLIFFPKKIYFHSCFILVFNLALVLLSSQAIAGQHTPLDAPESLAVNKHMSMRDIGLGIAGLLPANIECPNSLLHGVGGILSPNPTSAMEYPVIGSIVLGRSPIHILRLNQLNDIFADCVSNLRKQYGDAWSQVLTAKITHAVVNHVLPITYMSIMAERDFPLFAWITLPPLMLSYYARGLEVSPDNTSLMMDPYTLPIVAAGVAARGLVVQKIVENTLQHNDPILRATASWGAGITSVGLSYMFDRQKLAQYIGMINEHSIGFYSANLQAVLITSAYYGFTNALQISALLGVNQTALTFLAGSYLVLETATEVVSIRNNFHRVKSKLSRWWSSRAAN